VRVLLVSEDAGVRRRAGSALTLHVGAQIIEVDSGEDARVGIAAGEYTADVFVVDADLYPRGGFALLYDLHAQADLEGWTLPPSVVLTARPQDRFLVNWSRAEASLMKPINPFELTRVVGELVATAGSAEPV
jgi:CheY-like chemotaxis protein